MDEQGQARPRTGASHGDVADGADGARSAHVPAGPDAHGAKPPDTAEGSGPGETPAEPDPHDAEEDATEAEGPRPLGVEVELTGHEPVDAQLRRLEDADHLAVSGHLEVYEDVHRGLRDTLTALDRHEQ